jgi:hypothetical protein
MTLLWEQRKMPALPVFHRRVIGLSFDQLGHSDCVQNKFILLGVALKSLTSFMVPLGINGIPSNRSVTIKDYDVPNLMYHI